MSAIAQGSALFVFSFHSMGAIKDPMFTPETTALRRDHRCEL